MHVIEQSSFPHTVHEVLIMYAYIIRIPGAGSYPNIESRDSPVGGSCNYVNETSAAAVMAAAAASAASSDPKLIYKKSVFKKKSTSSTATVSSFVTYEKWPFRGIFSSAWNGLLPVYVGSKNLDL